jgi:methionyl-tRNA formyltransferase
VGRGQRIGPSPVKQFALRHGFPVFQPQSLRSKDAIEQVAGTRADALIVAAYGLMIPAPLLTCFPLGALNIHASLLPRWRGAAPIQRALLAGDAESGVSIMKMDEGLDTGPIFAQRAVPIGSDEDAGSLHDKLALLGSEMLAEVLTALAGGGLPARPQIETGVTYAHKISKSDLSLEWSREARELERAVRAFSPSPGATGRVENEPLKIRRARLVSASGRPGELLQGQDGSMIVACGREALQLIEVQRPGGRRMSAEEFLRGRPRPRPA